MYLGLDCRAKQVPNSALQSLASQCEFQQQDWVHGAAAGIKDLTQSHGKMIPHALSFPIVEALGIRRDDKGYDLQGGVHAIIWRLPMF
jgi:hypothetical protein